MSGTEPRIMFVTRKWAPAIGGMETYSMNLTEALVDIEPIEVIALPGRPDGMPPRFMALILFPFRVLLDLLRRDSVPEVLHLGDLALWPLALLPRMFFAPVRIVISAHGTDAAYHRRGGLKGRLYGAYLRMGAALLRKARIIANSQATASVAAETGWSNSTVVPLATDLRGPTPDGRHNGRLLFVGRLVERKGCGWFIQNVLPLLNSEIKLDVAGTGWDEEELAALRDPRVTHLGSLHGQDLIDAYRNALAVIVPNIEPATREYEGFGLVAPEAAACGGLVIAARCGGLNDAVIDQVTGILCDSGNVQAWHTMLDEVVSWPAASRHAFVKAAQRKAKHHFSWGRVARQTHKLYDMEAS